ncbi:MAG: tRNA epoxyqueuosine(34) reductase QueG [Holophagaceae bacterium]|jgi:epoxyqueuosine reductase
MDPKDLKHKIINLAFTEGFGRAGIASLEPFTNESKRLDAWFRKNHHQYLPYLNPAKMLMPKGTFGSSEVALVVFYPYARPDKIPGESGTQKASRYLWGEDYHWIIKKKLLRILESIHDLDPTIEGKVCVDTAPLLERQLAQRAGIGWQGKNTLLIADQDGSWGFLGVLLLNVELPVDKPFGSEQCGNCSACLDACPTGALVAFELNPNLCMTTYTIETEREPPLVVSRAIQETGWIAGCDICQEVCPWNRKPLWGNESVWGGLNSIHSVPTDQISFSSSQWRKFNRKSALRRVSRRHWLSTLRRVGLLMDPKN